MTFQAVDIFCGAGGWSHGWRTATGTEPMLGVNHCAHAVHLHRLNHPTTEHHLKDVWEVDPTTALAGRRVDWLHGSPDCTHHSRAKGGKPREQKIRALADVLIEWVRVGMPSVFSLENVLEWLDWGPLDDAGHPIKSRKGELFREWLGKLQALGYVVEWRVLCAADYGAPTIRKRLFLIARRDGQPIRWPTPTHADPSKRDLFSAGLLPWRTAADCIDWSIPVRSIFDRKKPLAPATCRRIAAGIVRFVLRGKPFIVTCNHGKEGFRGQGLDSPMNTVTASHDANGLVVGSLIQTGYGERQGQAPRALDLQQPLGTVVAGGAKHGLVAAFLQQNFTGMVGKPLRVPVPTITARDHHSLVTATLKAHDVNGSGGGSRSTRRPADQLRRRGLEDAQRAVAGASDHAATHRDQGEERLPAGEGLLGGRAAPGDSASLGVDGPGRADPRRDRDQPQGRQPDEQRSREPRTGDAIGEHPTLVPGVGAPAAEVDPEADPREDIGSREGTSTGGQDLRRDRGGAGGGSDDGIQCRAREVAAFLIQFYSRGGQHSSVDAPLPAVVTKARHGLVTVTIDGADYVLADIGLRMLEPRELARAQGFPDTYQLEGTKAQQIARIGNSVCPHVAAAIVAANLGREAAVA